MNFPSWDWKLVVLKPNPTLPRLHHAFIDMLNDCGLEQLVEEPTRQENTLDLIITNSPNLSHVLRYSLAYPTMMQSTAK